MRQLLLENLKTYPQMQIQDCVKLCYQSRFGPGHFVDPARSLARLEAEQAAVTPDEAVPLLEQLGGGFYRLNLASPDASRISPATLNRLFVLSANQPAQGMEAFLTDLSLLGEMIAQGALPFSAAEWEAYLTGYKEAGYPAVSHTETYRAAYRPAYRVLHRRFCMYWLVLLAVDKLLQTGGGVVAIDGHSGTGKSGLAAILAEVFPAAVIHMDDFFLQDSQRTPQRLAEPGGNLDYERFLAEVVPGLKPSAAFSYGVFDCMVRQITESRPVEDLPLRIVEGCYSLHPKWRDKIDLAVVLTADPETRINRIEARNGPFLAKRFREDWIPKEAAYLDAFDILDSADLLFSTTNSF